MPKIFEVCWHCFSLSLWMTPITVNTFIQTYVVFNFVAVSSSTSFLLSSTLAVLLFAGMQLYKVQLASHEWTTILGGFLGSLLFCLILTVSFWMSTENKWMISFFSFVGYVCRLSRGCMQCVRVELAEHYASKNNAIKNCLVATFENIIFLQIWYIQRAVSNNGFTFLYICILFCVRRSAGIGATHFLMHCLMCKCLIVPLK